MRGKFFLGMCRCFLGYWERGKCVCSLVEGVGEDREEVEEF